MPLAFQRIVTSAQQIQHAQAAMRRRWAAVRAAEREPRPEGARRALNVVVAAVGLVVAAPVVLAIAALVKFTGGGRIFYAQTRVGLDRRTLGDRDRTNHRRRIDYGGRPFTIYKFCTMDPARSPEGAQVWAAPDDPRVTRIGRLLRKYRLDELPQLWNVLRGDMNVVGPRPEQPKIFNRLRAKIERYGERQRVRPGITGWAQINQAYDRSVEDVRRKVAFDLEYLARHSVLEDLKIMLCTVPVVVFKRGAW